MAKQELLKTEARAYDAVGVFGAMEDSREPKIADLDLAEVAIDEDVVALEVPMDYRRIMTVEISEALEDLASPVLYWPNAHSWVLPSVPAHY